MIKVAVVATTPAVRAGLRAMLSSGESVEVIAEAATLTDIRVRALMLLHHVDAGNQQAPAVENAKYFPALTLVAACDHDDFVVFLNL